MAAGTQRAEVGPYERSAEVVRTFDRDRYLADLFAPQPFRRHLFALHAFDVEIGRIRDAVSEPAIGEIRLQWWRDAVLTGAPGGHPVAAALGETIATLALPQDAFARFLDARVFDLYDDPMPTLNDLEGYAGDTASALVQLAAIALAGGADPGSAAAAGHAGVALTLTAIARSLPRNAERGQTFLPEAMINSRGVDMATVLAGQATPELGALLSDLRTITRQHLAAANAELARADPIVRPAFLPLALVEPYLDRMDRPDYAPFRPPELSAWRRQWILWRAARAG